jgi:hypothetical protein
MRHAIPVVLRKDLIEQLELLGKKARNLEVEVDRKHHRTLFLGPAKLQAKDLQRKSVEMVDDRGGK